VSLRVRRDGDVPANVLGDADVPSVHAAAAAVANREAARDSMTERILRVENPRFIAHVVYRKIGGHWVCWEAPSVLYWFMHTPMSNIKTFLRGPAARKGWRYYWLEARPPGFDVNNVISKEEEHGRRDLHERKPEDERQRDGDKPAGGEG
jgi:hypothetical protein